MIVTANPKSQIPNPEQEWWTHRDREEELVTVARMIKADRRRGEAPDIGEVMGDEAAAAVMLSRRLPARFPQRGEVVEQRRRALRQRGNLRRPVVHLQVDVQVVVAVPGRLHLLAPDPLEVGGQRPGSGTGDEEIAAVLEVESQQARIILGGNNPASGTYDTNVLVKGLPSVLGTTVHATVWGVDEIGTGHR